MDGPDRDQVLGICECCHKLGPLDQLVRAMMPVGKRALLFRPAMVCEECLVHCHHGPCALDQQRPPPTPPW